MVNTITERQVALLVSLQKEREPDVISIQMLGALRREYRQNRASSQDASAVISALMLAPKRAPELSVGIYEAGDRLFRVYLSQNSGLLLVKEVLLSEGGTYRYLGRASRHVPLTARRLPREEVAERTLAYGSGTCMVCGRRLDDPESVDRGVGPVCWEDYS